MIPIAVIALAAACSDPATSPTSVTTLVNRPQFSVSAGTFGTGALTNTSTLALPSGGHLQSGSVFCVVGSDLSITCSSTGTYTINGIGNTNANASLSASYSATVDCTNHGGQLVAVKSQPETAPVSSGTLRAKNGSLTVTQLVANAPTAAQFEAAATCPNGNWTKSLEPGITLVSFEYTLTFVGFSQSTVDIAAS
ncbi:MAG TPA: hypothetical protein VJQ46_08130 [Gemmatimonadales bacterium]|nr:hypothetical protein [Gemmatimonadales bacterium]